mmetsp:Transcript_110950/g.353478  ORF Transcript_110950/g.353478 Transcript_110950/m.353478 type:complete len:161 (+) Transcript_110950:184-666(+)
MENYIQFLDSAGTVDAEAVESTLQFQSSGIYGDEPIFPSAMPSCELAVVLPKGYVAGRTVRVEGPDGFMLVPTDADMQFKAGSQQRLRVAAPPDFRVEVPPGVRAGSQLKFRRGDGIEATFLMYDRRHLWSACPRVHLLAGAEQRKHDGDTCFALQTSTL